MYLVGNRKKISIRSVLKLNIHVFNEYRCNDDISIHFLLTSNYLHAALF